MMTPPDCDDDASFLVCQVNWPQHQANHSTWRLIWGTKQSPEMVCVAASKSLSDGMQCAPVMPFPFSFCFLLAQEGFTRLSERAIAAEALMDGSIISRENCV